VKQLLNGTDWIVLAVAVALAPVLFAAAWSGGGGQAYVEVYRPGQATERLVLTGDRTVHVHGSLGESVIELHGGRVRFVHSPCRAKRCVLAGWQHTPGSVAACVPNQVAIAVVANGPVIDAINY